MSMRLMPTGRVAFCGAVRPVHPEPAPLPRPRRAGLRGCRTARRLAPPVHLAMRGTVSRAELRRVLAATYHQVWWPSTSAVRFDGDHLPVWHEESGRYLDPATGELLASWEEALDAIGPHDQPLHVARFGAKFDAQGVPAGS